MYTRYSAGREWSDSGPDRITRGRENQVLGQYETKRNNTERKNKSSLK
jgi:hypothetical protein